MEIRRVAVVLNGKAGALLDQAEARPMLRDALAAAGLDAVFLPAELGSLSERMQRAATEDVQAVVVAGGDGTVACAAHVLAGSGLPLGILPFGTMNLLAKDLGLPIGDVAAALKTVAAGRVRTIDVGDVNGRSFLCASMLGLPARLGRTREETRGSGLQLWSRMTRAGLRLLQRARRLHVRMSLDGDPAELRAASLTVTVNQIDEGCGRAFGRVCLDGGRLGVYVIEHLSLTAVLRLAVRMMTGRWRDDRAVTESHASTVRITRRRAVHVMNDGELSLLTPPLHYSVRPGALRVLVP